MQVLEWGRRGFDEGTLARRGMLRHGRCPPEVAGERTKRCAQAHTALPAGLQAHHLFERLLPGADAAERRAGDRGHRAHHAARHGDGRRPRASIDVLVCATGFDTVHLLSSCGDRARRPHAGEAWADGPEAYHGITVSGFPNLFLMLGPNTATGHTSTLLYIEPERAARHRLHAGRAHRRPPLDRRARRGATRTTSAAGASGQLGVEPVPQLVPHGQRPRRRAVPRLHRARVRAWRRHSPGAPGPLSSTTNRTRAVYALGRWVPAGRVLSHT
jgi:hypothetical protein